MLITEQRGSSLGSLPRLFSLLDSSWTRRRRRRRRSLSLTSLSSYTYILYLCCTHIVRVYDAQLHCMTLRPSGKRSFYSFSFSSYFSLSYFHHRPSNLKVTSLTRSLQFWWYESRLHHLLLPLFWSLYISCSPVCWVEVGKRATR